MIYVLLIISNILFVFFWKAKNRYWIFCIPLFVGLGPYFTVERIVNAKRTETLEARYNESTPDAGTGDHTLWMQLKEKKIKTQQFSAIMINLLVLQSFLTLAFQVTGKRFTGMKLYSLTSWIFGLISIVLLWIWMMRGIVPSGGMIR